MMPRLDELNKDEFSQWVKKDPLVILPIGAVEEHGPHLPLCTDSIQAEALADRIAKRFDALVAPSIRYGECTTVKNFPGTITLTFDTLRDLVKEILSELYRNGIRRILVLSGHAGRVHLVALREAGKMVVDEYRDLKLMILSDYEIAYELEGIDFNTNDGHAGTIETSRVMQLREDLVKGTPPASLKRPPPYYQVVHDPESFFPSGLWGDPTKATKEKGQMVEDLVLNELGRIIQEVLLK